MRPINLSSMNLLKVVSATLAETKLSAQELTAITITGITHNDKQVLPGDLFIAIPGAKSHGAQYATSALKQGAVAVLTDQEGAMLISDAPVLIVSNPRQVAGELSALFYNEPMRDLASIGITGTNGKTTVSTLLYQIFEAANRQAGLIGTIETRIGRDVVESLRTTPESTDLQALAAAMREQHVRHLVMEVSSHALALKRLQGAYFSYVAFTNLSQDHLDFHGTLENYFLVKAALFTHILAERAVINIDDPYGARLADMTELPVISISRLNPKANWHFVDIVTRNKKIDFKIRGTGGILIESTTRLRGGYNLENLLLAIALAVESGVDPITIAAISPKLVGAAGRLEEVDFGQPFSAFVDYAHTPDAVISVLQTIREFTKGRVIAVLGCGGDRDSTKRPLMGVALTAGSDLPIFTSDNPRSEDSEEILRQMVGSQRGISPDQIIKDRQMAIEYAVKMAQPGDTVAILGKGHEKGQEISGKTVAFDDRLSLAQAIAGKQ